MHYRRRNGESSSIDDYILRYPQYSSNLTLPRAAPDGRTSESGEAVKQIGSYELRDQIGSGSFGTVWRAWHPQLQRMDAIKLPLHGFDDSEQIDVLRHEARAAANLDHPNIVRVIGVEEWARRPYIIFDYIEGVTLKQWMQREEPDHRCIVELVAKLADAIQHAHELNIVHRDIKPGNILVDEQGEPHITDFGLAKRLDAQSTIAVQGIIMGTVPYMSPEQVAADHDNVEPSSDVYSLGVILYELLCGSLPFEGSKPTLIHDIQFTDPPALRRRDKSVPVELETVCLKALEKDTTDRYPSAAGLRDDLNCWLAGLPVQTRRVSLVQKSARWIRRHPVLFVIRGAAITVSLVTLLALTFEVANDGWRSDQSMTNSDLQNGSFEVHISTVPAGATVAIRRNDRRHIKNEIDAAPVLRPEEKTPLVCNLGRGEYNVTATWRGHIRDAIRSVPNLPVDGTEPGLQSSTGTSHIVKWPSIWIVQTDKAVPE